MVRLLFLTPILFLCAAGWSCAPSLNVPPPPDIEPVLAAYENPTANVRGEVMTATAAGIEEARSQIDDSEFYNEILDVIIDVQEGLDGATDEDGNLTVNGVEFPNPNGAVTIDYICEGWDENVVDPDRANGTLQLTMTLGDGKIGPVVWGGVDNCQYLTAIGNETFESFYDGDVSVSFGDFVSTSQSLPELEKITFIANGTIGFAGGESRIDQSFRVANTGRLDILVEADRAQTFIYFFEADRLAQGINDATGVFACSLEERECENESDRFSW